MQQLQQLCELHFRGDSEDVLYLPVANCRVVLTALPGHESLQHGHVLLGEVVLSHHVLQCVEVTRNHLHGLHLVLALDKAGSVRQATDVNHMAGDVEPRELSSAGHVRHKHTLMSPSSTSRDETKLYPWKEGVAKAFLRRASATKEQCWECV